MRISSLLLPFLIVSFGFLACSNSSEQVKSSGDKEKVTISISSSNPDNTIIFEAITTGEWQGSAPADSQSTPFELVVNGNNFYGTFHKLEGKSQMVIKLVGEKNEGTRWKMEKEYDRLSQIILNGKFTSVDGK